mmetsp:Transcript_30790/g.52123  ORF Transcript_30790/g.52123 Transcript_30790/m.52123 type:complete len:118 (+) Transcript_30790:1069-1422(+)|eukprot:jgi/Bigna1/61885/fgenesh1_kg.27_\
MKSDSLFHDSMEAYIRAATNFCAFLNSHGRSGQGGDKQHGDVRLSTVSDNSSVSLGINEEKSTSKNPVETTRRTSKPKSSRKRSKKSTTTISNIWEIVDRLQLHCVKFWDKRERRSV